ARSRDRSFSHSVLWLFSEVAYRAEVSRPELPAMYPLPSSGNSSDTAEFESDTQSETAERKGTLMSDAQKAIHLIREKLAAIKETSDPDLEILNAVEVGLRVYGFDYAADEVDRALETLHEGRN